jgi:hypothetical protein
LPNNQLRKEPNEPSYAACVSESASSEVGLVCVLSISLLTSLSSVVSVSSGD